MKFILGLLTVSLIYSQQLGFNLKYVPELFEQEFIYKDKSYLEFGISYHHNILMDELSIGLGFNYSQKTLDKQKATDQVGNVIGEIEFGFNQFILGIPLRLKFIDFAGIDVSLMSNIYYSNISYTVDYDGVLPFTEYSDNYIFFQPGIMISKQINEKLHIAFIVFNYSHDFSFIHKKGIVAIGGLDVTQSTLSPGFEILYEL